MKLGARRGWVAGAAEFQVPRATALPGPSEHAHTPRDNVHAPRDQKVHVPGGAPAARQKRARLPTTGAAPEAWRGFSKLENWHAVRRRARNSS